MIHAHALHAVETYLNFSKSKYRYLPVPPGTPILLRCPVCIDREKQNGLGGSVHFTLVRSWNKEGLRRGRGGVEEERRSEWVPVHLTTANEGLPSNARAGGTPLRREVKRGKGRAGYGKESRGSGVAV